MEVDLECQLSMGACANVAGNAWFLLGGAHKAAHIPMLIWQDCGPNWLRIPRPMWQSYLYGCPAKTIKKKKNCQEKKKINFLKENQ